MTSTVEIAVSPGKTLIVDGKEYTLAYGLSAVIAAENATGLSLKTLLEWMNLPHKHLPAVLDAGLRKNHPELPADFTANLCEQLNPESLYTISVALWELNYPKVMERIAAEKAKPKGASPNA